MSKKYRLPSKTIILSGEIEEKSITRCMEKILDINECREAYQDNDQPIKLIINSPGGSVYDGFALIGIMENSIIPITTHAYGHIMSMALPIFASGVARIASQYTTFMYHQLAWGSYSEKLEYHKQEVNQGQYLHNMYDDILFKKTKLPKKILSETTKTKSEWYFGAEEAKKYRLVDYII